MPKPSKVRLAEALHSIEGMPRYMIKRAIDGYYHDFESELTFPELQLVVDLRDIARTPSTPRNCREPMRELARRVMEGDFDAGKEEADAWFASPEGQATIKELLGDADGIPTSH